MTKSKIFAPVMLLIALFTTDCAFGGIKKPTVFVDKYNNIPADIPLQFDSRYERFISDKEMEAFHKLKTDEERQDFQDKFWAERDPDPTTPENEEKERIDQLIENITGEPFLSTPGVFGLSFRSNGGFRGEMAHVYLLHGEPDAIDSIEGNSFVDLMLWIYANPENGGILYAFLFYQKGSEGAPFRLFPQDSYQMDQCGAIYEVATLRAYHYLGIDRMQGCPEDLYQVYNDIWSANGRGGILDGQFFAWALFNFSDDPGLKVGKVLEPPKPASEIAKQSKARVTGEAPELVGKAGTDYILASCESCNSMIPAELQLGKEFALSVRRSDVDWRIVSDKVKEVELKIRIVLENTITHTRLVFEGPGPVIHQELRNPAVENVSDRTIIKLLAVSEVDQIPAGTYHVSVYVKNTLTKKYNAWSENFTK